MTFAWPHLLWLLLAPLALLAVGLLRARRGIARDSSDRILRGEAGHGSLTLSAGAAAGRERHSRPLLCLAAACLVLALARPQWGVIDEPVHTASREVLIALDLSRSMLATDVKPSRLERARLLVHSLLDHLRGERVGLVVFSGTAFLQSPLSTDYEIMRDLLPELGPDYLPEGGTAYQAMLESSLDAFGRDTTADRYLVVLSDGEALDDGWKSLLPDLGKRGVRIIALGVGTAAGSVLPDGGGGVVKDERGAAVLSRLEPSTLEALASATSGIYRDAASWVDLPALLRATVETGRVSTALEVQKLRRVERYQWPMALALILALLSLATEFAGRIRPRALRIHSVTTKALPCLALGVLCLAPAPRAVASPSAAATGAPAAQAQAQKPAAPAEGREHPLIASVRELSQRPDLAADDYRRLAEETLAWGKTQQDARQAFPEGPVRDALLSVGLGETRDARAADWGRLRAELEALLKPSQDKQQDQKQKDEEQKQSPDKQDKPQDKQDQQDKQDAKSPSESRDKPDDKPDQKQDKKEQENKQPEASKQQAFGKMNESATPPPPREQEMQQVGGKPAEQQPDNTDPSLVVPLEKLEKLKDQDNPGRLFELMQDERKPAPANTKNW